MTGYITTDGIISFSFSPAQSEEKKELLPEKIIYNGRTTIVYWNDGDKSVATADREDVFSELTGFLVCLGKKMYGKRSEPKKVLRDGKYVRAEVYDKRKDKVVKVRGKTQLERFISKAQRQSMPESMPVKRVNKKK